MNCSYCQSTHDLIMDTVMDHAGRIVCHCDCHKWKHGLCNECKVPIILEPYEIGWKIKDKNVCKDCYFIEKNNSGNLTKVLMTEPELLSVFESIFKNDDLYPGTKMELMLKLLKITNWLKHENLQ